MNEQSNQDRESSVTAVAYWRASSSREMTPDAILTTTSDPKVVVAAEILVNTSDVVEAYDTVANILRENEWFVDPDKNAVIDWAFTGSVRSPRHFALGDTYEEGEAFTGDRCLPDRNRNTAREGQPQYRADIGLKDLKEADESLTGSELRTAIEVLIAEANIAYRQGIEGRALEQYQAAARLYQRATVKVGLLEEAITAQSVRLFNQTPEALLKRPDDLSRLTELGRLYRAVRVATGHTDSEAAQRAAKSSAD